MALLWFAGISWDTKIRQIGWFYVFLFVAIVFLVHALVMLVRDWRH